MEAVVEEQGHSMADNEIEIEDGAVNIDHEEDFDFDIGGPEDNLGTEAGAEFHNQDLAYRVDGSDAIGDTYAAQTSEAGAQLPAEESYDQENHDQDYDQNALDASEFDVTADVQGSGEDNHDGNTEGDDNIDEAEKGQLEEFGVNEDEISYEENAAEYEGLEDALQPDAEQAHGTMDTATSVEYSYHEEKHLETQTDAGDDIDVHVEGDHNLLLEDDHPNEIGEGEPASTADRHSEGHVHSFEAQTDVEDDVSVSQHKVDSIDGHPAAADWDGDGNEDQQHADEQPNSRVLWRTEEFRLFAESPTDDPDEYFLKDHDSLQQPLSQFLSGLRQVIANELTPSEELFVKVDGLGLEFGETTTVDFLEKTTFGQIVDLHNRLAKLDDGHESPELYLYLDARPHCLHRFDELTNGAQDGKGLSDFALYYDEISTDMPADENEDEQYESPQDFDSDDISLDGSYGERDELQGDTDETQQTGQSYNPFRITEKQRQEIEVSSFADSKEDGGEKNPSFADTVEAHSFDDDSGNADVRTGDDHDDLDIEATDVLNDAPVDENLQDAVSGLEGNEDVAIEASSDHHEVEGDDEHDDAADGEVVGAGSIADVLDESRGEHDLTDDHDTADHDEYLDLGNDTIDTTDAQTFEYTEEAGTPGLVTRNSSATATLDGDYQGNGDNVSVAQDSADASHPIEAPDQPDDDHSQNDVDEIDWKEGEDDEDDVADQNPTGLSPSSISAKRSREEDEDDNGLGDESTVKRRRT